MGLTPRETAKEIQIRNQTNKEMLSSYKMEWYEAIRQFCIIELFMYTYIT